MKKKDVLWLIYLKNKLGRKLFCFSFLCMLCLLSVTASAQQKVTMNLGKTTLGAVFKEIQKQTGRTILYNDDRVNLEFEVIVNVKDMGVEELLRQVLEGSGSVFWILDDNILIMPKPKEGKKSSFLRSRGKWWTRRGRPYPERRLWRKARHRGRRHVSTVHSALTSRT